MNASTPAALRAANKLKSGCWTNPNANENHLGQLIDAETGLPELLEYLKSIRSKLAFEAACNRSAQRGASFASELETLDAILAKHSA